MERYKIEMSNGKIINVPNDRARSEHEVISEHGLQAVLERVSRSSAYIKLINQAKRTRIVKIILPDGSERNV